MRLELKILYFAPDIPVPGTHGGSTHAYEVAKNISMLGNDVFVISQREQGNKKTDKIMSADGSIIVYRVPQLWFPISCFYLLILTLNIAKKMKVDLIYIRGLPLDISATLVGAVLGLPLIFEINHPAWALFSLKRADHIITTSESLLKGNLYNQKLAKHHPKEKVSIVTWAGNVTNFNPDISGLAVREKFEIPENSIVVGYVGAFLPWHDLYTLARASSIVSQVLSNIRFLIVGDGPLRSSLIKYIAKNGLSKLFIFTGIVPYRDLPRYVAAMDITTATYDLAYPLLFNEFGFYGTPIKLFEFMAAAKPIIASKTENIEKVLTDGKSGVLLQKGGYRELAEKIIDLATNTDLMSFLAKNARDEVIKKYSWDIHVKKLNDVFTKVLSNHHNISLKEKMIVVLAFLPNMIYYTTHSLIFEMRKRCQLKRTKARYIIAKDQ